ncbi:hypothetical protein B0H14DRAFT_2647990 [Mycena olivaceomarginata]|nr:hypothetical protein B0H14DRAFT_2647990 [Mycena olivaceomarginata]
MQSVKTQDLHRADLGADVCVVDTILQVRDEARNVQGTRPSTRVAHRTRRECSLGSWIVAREEMQREENGGAAGLGVLKVGHETGDDGGHETNTYWCSRSRSTPRRTSGWPCCRVGASARGDGGGEGAFWVAGAGGVRRHWRAACANRGVQDGRRAAGGGGACGASKKFDECMAPIDWQWQSTNDEGMNLKRTCSRSTYLEYKRMGVARVRRCRVVQGRGLTQRDTENAYRGPCTHMQMSVGVCVDARRPCTSRFRGQSPACRPDEVRSERGRGQLVPVQRREEQHVFRKHAGIGLEHRETRRVGTDLHPRAELVLKFGMRHERTDTGLEDALAP